MGTVLDWNMITKPIDVSVEEAEQETYIFYNQYSQLKQICEPYLRGEIVKEYRVVSIVGERGMGKTSLLKTFKKRLEKSQNHVIGPIDPEIFDSSMGIIEILLSEIHSDVLKITKRCKSNIEENIEEYTIAKLHEQSRRCLKTLANIRSEKADFIDKHSTAEVLEIYKNRVDFQQLLSELLEQYLKLVGKQNLFVMIDDLDLVNPYTISNMTEDIRKYLTDSVSVIISYRGSQLNNAIVQNKLDLNKVLIDKDIIGVEEVTEQATKYIEKFAPMQYRVSMTIASMLYEKPIREILKNIVNRDGEIKHNENISTALDLDGKEGNKSLKNFLYDVINLKVGIDIIPVDIKEGDERQIPNTLRGMLELSKILIVNMKTTENLSFYEQAKVKLSNIKIYRSYLLDHSMNTLPFKYYELIVRWENKGVEGKNHLICDYLWKEFILTDEEMYHRWQEGGELKIFEIQPYNIAIADVYEVLETIKAINYKFKDLYFFVYVIKILYSLLLLELYLKAFIEYRNEKSYSSNQYLEQYLTLLNCYVIPDYVKEELTRQYPEYACEFVYKKSEKNNQKMREFIDLCCYYEVTSNGETINGARRKFGNENKRFQKAFVYRKIFNNALAIDTLFDTRTYKYDPFAFLGKRAYVEETMKQWATIENTEDVEYPFVLFSMFDIDVFILNNYVRRSEQAPVLYFYKQINLLLKENQTKNKYGRIDRIQLTKPPMYKGSWNISAFEMNRTVFSQDLMDYIQETILSVEKEYKRLNDVSETELIKTINLYILNENYNKNIWQKGVQAMNELVERDCEKYEFKTEMDKIISAKRWFEPTQKLIIDVANYMVKIYETSR